MEEGRLRLADLQPGDKIGGFECWGCVPAGAHRHVKAADNGGLYVDCVMGKHYLDGLEDDDGFLVGLWLIEKRHA
jgi:hypothetical protein